MRKYEYANADQIIRRCACGNNPLQRSYNQSLYTSKNKVNLIPTSKDDSCFSYQKAYNSREFRYLNQFNEGVQNPLPNSYCFASRMQKGINETELKTNSQQNDEGRRQIYYREQRYANNPEGNYATKKENEQLQGKRMSSLKERRENKKRNQDNIEQKENLSQYEAYQGKTYQRRSKKFKEFQTEKNQGQNEPRRTPETKRPAEIFDYKNAGIYNERNVNYGQTKKPEQICTCGKFIEEQNAQRNEFQRGQFQDYNPNVSVNKAQEEKTLVLLPGQTIEPKTVSEIIEDPVEETIQNPDGTTTVVMRQTKITKITQNTPVDVPKVDVVRTAPNLPLVKQNITYVYKTVTSNKNAVEGQNQLKNDMPRSEQRQDTGINIQYNSPYAGQSAGFPIKYETKHKYVPPSEQQNDDDNRYLRQDGGFNYVNPQRNFMSQARPEPMQQENQADMEEHSYEPNDDEYEQSQKFGDDQLMKKVLDDLNKNPGNVTVEQKQERLKYFKYLYNHCCSCGICGDHDENLEKLTNYLSDMEENDKKEVLVRLYSGSPDNENLYRKLVSILKKKEGLKKCLEIKKNQQGAVIDPNVKKDIKKLLKTNADKKLPNEQKGKKGSLSKHKDNSRFIKSYTFNQDAKYRPISTGKSQTIEFNRRDFVLFPQPNTQLGKIKKDNLKVFPSKEGIQKKSSGYGNRPEYSKKQPKLSQNVMRNDLAAEFKGKIQAKNREELNMANNPLNISHKERRIEKKFDFGFEQLEKETKPKNYNYKQNKYSYKKGMVEHGTKGDVNKMKFENENVNKELYSGKEQDKEKGKENEKHKEIRKLEGILDDSFLSVSKYGANQSRGTNPFEGPSPYNQFYKDRTTKIKKKLSAYEVDEPQEK